ncbi:PAS domain S-box protein, partial [Clostridiaceae bacterium HSG29]|nr:PAS domain S-box protein [Clostridiaceae bacterium HSG29]
NIEDAKNKKISVLEDDLGHDYIVEEGITDKIFVTNSIEKTLKELEQGKVDCAIVSRLQGLRIIKNSNIQGIKPVGEPIIQSKYCFAVPEGHSHDLAIFNEGLSIIKTSGKYDEIYDEWFGVYEVEDNSKTIKLLLTILSSFLLLIILITIWNRLLKEKVNIRTNELKESKEKYKTIFKSIGEGIVTTDIEGKITSMNPVAEMLTGYSLNEALGSDFNDIFNLTDIETLRQVKNLVKKVLSGEITDNISKRIRLKSLAGNEYIVTDTCTLVINDNEEIKGIVIVIHDITMEYKQKETIKKNEKRLSLLSDNLPNGYLYQISTINGKSPKKFTFISKGVKKIHGLDMSSFNESTSVIYNQIYQDDLKILKELEDEALMNIHDLYVEVRIQTSSGEKKWISISASPRIINKDEIVWDGIVFDITYRKNTERVLKFNNERLETLIKLNNMKSENKNELIKFALDAAVNLTNSTMGYIAFVSEDESVLSMHAWSDYAMEQCKVQEKAMVYPIEKTGLWGEAIRQRKAVITNNYASMNSKKKGIPEGHVYIKRHMNIPVFDGEKIVIVAGVANKSSDYLENDVHQLSLLMSGLWAIICRKNSEEELNNYKENLEKIVEKRTKELKKTNDELERFAYIASHDLQEPVRMVTSYMQLLEKRYIDKFDQDANDFIEFAVDGAKRMQSLVNDLLKYSRIGVKGKEFAYVDLNKILIDVIDNLQIIISENDVEIHYDKLPTVIGDDIQLEQLFENLIENAIKYRSDRNPKIMIDFEDIDDYWEISITDNGIGIKTEYYEQIFQVFKRLHGNNDYSGNGIGLAVCEKIVNHHGGTIKVKSEIDKGTTFSFSIKKKEMTNDSK